MPEPHRRHVRLLGGALALGAATAALVGGAAPATAATAASAIPAAERTGTVALSGRASRLTVRRTPGAGRVGSLRRGAAVRVSCQANGSAADGRFGRSRIWDRVTASNGRSGYVPDGSITVDKGSMVAKYCGLPDPATIDAARRGGTALGYCSSRAPVAVRAPYPNRPAFLADIGAAATASDRSTGVPASVILAQAILESGSGTANAGANNYFGIKARATATRGIYAWGDVAQACVHKPTSEQEGGRLVRTIGQFRAYPDLQGSLTDHGLFLRQNVRYAPAFAVADDPEAFARAIRKAGYATDARYAQKLISLIRGERLTRFDAR